MGLKDQFGDKAKQAAEQAKSALSDRMKGGKPEDEAQKTAETQNMPQEEQGMEEQRREDERGW